MVDRPLQTPEGSTVLTIDPGIGGTGLAIFCQDSPRPVHLGAVRGKRKGTFIERCDQLIEAVLGWVRDCGLVIEVVVIEDPELMSGSKKGIAAKNSGAAMKLKGLAWMMVGAFRFGSDDPPTVVMISPEAWKGQLSKEMSTARILKRVDDDVREALANDSGSHTTDAVGMGLWIYGEF